MLKKINVLVKTISSKVLLLQKINSKMILFCAPYLSIDITYIICKDFIISFLSIGKCLLYWLSKQERWYK